MGMGNNLGSVIGNAAQQISNPAGQAPAAGTGGKGGVAGQIGPAVQNITQGAQGKGGVAAPSSINSTPNLATRPSVGGMPAPGMGGKGGIGGSQPGMPGKTWSQPGDMLKPGMGGKGGIGGSQPGMPGKTWSQPGDMLKPGMGTGTVNDVGGQQPYSSPLFQQLQTILNGGGAGVGSTATTQPPAGMGGKGGMPLGPNDAPIMPAGAGGKGGMPLGPNDAPIGGGNKGGIRPFGNHPGYKGGPKGHGPKGQIGVPQTFPTNSNPNFMYGVGNKGGQPIGSTPINPLQGGDIPGRPGLSAIGNFDPSQLA